MVGNLRTGAAMTAYMDHKDLANEVIDQARAQEITDGVHRVLDRIASAESAAGRAAGSVQLLAATKTRDVGEILDSLGVEDDVPLIEVWNKIDALSPATRQALRNTDKSLVHDLVFANGVACSVTSFNLL